MNLMTEVNFLSTLGLYSSDHCPFYHEAEGTVQPITYGFYKILLAVTLGPMHFTLLVVLLSSHHGHHEE